MPNLLSRFASDLFWLARYMERAEALARLIDISKNYAGSHRGDSSWERILRICGDLETYKEAGGSLDSASVLAYYLLDAKNPTSVAFAINAARDNARGARHLISTELWTHLNTFHNRYMKLTARDIRISNVSNICQEIKTGCQAFEGIVQSTMTRGEPWYFYDLGKNIERADQTTRVLDIGYISLSSGDDDALVSVQWNTLVRTLAGYHLYRSKFPAGEYARDVASFLLFETEFTRSVAFCVESISVSLGQLTRRLPMVPTEAVQSAQDALVARLAEGPTKPITPARLHDFLDRLQLSIGDVSEAIAITYFAKEVEAEDRAAA